MTRKVKLVDVITTYYKVINGDPQFEEKRFYNPDAALEIANHHDGEVFEVSKRTVETIEFKKLS